MIDRSNYKMSDGDLSASICQRLRDAARGIPIGKIGLWRCTIKPQSVRARPSFIRKIALGIVDIDVAMRGLPGPAKLPGC